MITPEQIIDKFGITEPGEIDLEAIAFDFGIKIKYREIQSCDARLVGLNDKAVVTVDSKASHVRQRFSIGHELGHWFRDNGKLLFKCKKENIGYEYSGIPLTEKKANDFASDLLLLKKLFVPMAKKRRITIETAVNMSKQFQTSVTATSFRLIQLGSYPSMFVSFNRNGKRWFRRSPDLPEEFWPHEELHHESIAFELLYKSNNVGDHDSSVLEADIWINRRDASKYYVVESSMKTTEESVISLIWWKDEAQIIDL